MSLWAFLNPEVPEKDKKVYLKRFKDENGEVQPFVIRALLQDEIETIQKQVAKALKGKNYTEIQQEVERRMIVTAVTYPPLNNEEFTNKFSCRPSEVPAKLFLPGEFTKLLNEIGALSGLDAPTNPIDDDLKN